MTSFRAFFAAFVAALVAFVDRARVAWYRRRRLPTVREALARNALPPARRLVSVDVGEVALPDDRSADYLSIPSSTKLVTARPAPVFRVASTRILPPPLVPVSVLRDAPWNVEAKRAMRSPVAERLRPGEVAKATPRLPALPRELGPIANPERFGLARDLSTSTERTRLADVRPELVRARGTLARESHRPPQLGVADLAAFALDDDARPFALAVPAPRRLPPRLSRARADFFVRYVDPHHAEAFAKPEAKTFADRFEAFAEPFFADPDIGALDVAFEWELDDELELQMREVREQFTLRRDITRAAFEEDELGALEIDSDELPAAMQAFTGLSFEELEPEPWAPLKMRLEAPPPEVAPFTEGMDRDLAWLFSAIREHR